VVGNPRPSETFWLVVQRMGETIAQALMATTLGILIAVPLSFLGARNLMMVNPVGTAVYYVARTAFNILRSIEPLIMAIVFVVWVGLGPFAGVLALVAHSVAALAKLYSEAIESIDPGPIEAITATGANRLQVIVYAVLPQVLPPFVAFSVYRWDINVRMSTIIGFVGGGGIGFLLQQWIRLSKYNEAATAIWAIAIVVSVLDYASAQVRERIV
jgi:phosphonate transport system permease protein